MTYILDLNWTPSEKFFMGAAGYWFKNDSDNASGFGDLDMDLYGVYANYNFTPAIALKGIYYFADYSSGVSEKFTSYGITNFEDSPKAWKAILDIDREALKFTSLWIESSEQDNTFAGYPDRYSIGGSAYAHVGANLEMKTVNWQGTSKFLFIKAEQEWSDKWSTYLRYVQADLDTAGLDDAKAYGVGVGYQYSPAVHFELAYGRVDRGSNDEALHPGAVSDKESVVRFKTTVSF